MSAQQTPDPHRPGLRARAVPNRPNKGYAGLLKLLLGAGGLLLLASYIGGKKAEAPPAPAANDSAHAGTSPAPSQPVVLQGKKEAMQANVDDAAFSISADGRALQVVGGVGRNFAINLKQALEANPYLQRIDITSGGGYAGSGLEAARLIRQYNLIVRVRSHCASMCVGLWAAAARREMEPDALIGLHNWNANCDAYPQPQRDQCAYAAQFWFEHDTVYDSWLRGAGFSERLLQLQERTTPENIALLHALQLWDEGVDFNVVDAQGRNMQRAEVLQFLSAKYQR